MILCLGCMGFLPDGASVCPHCGYNPETDANDPSALEAGSTLLDRYIIGRVLGLGSFGVTYLAWDAAEEEKVAVKEYLPRSLVARVPGSPELSPLSPAAEPAYEKGLEDFMSEARRLSLLGKEGNIARIHSSAKANGTAYMVTDLLEGESILLPGFAMATANDNTDYPGRSPREWKISVSPDGETWFDYAWGDDSFFEETNFTYYAAEAGAVGVSWIRFRAESAESEIFQVSELVFFGEKTADLPAADSSETDSSGAD